MEQSGWRIDNNTSASMTRTTMRSNNIIANTSDVQVDDIDAVRGLTDE
jgi:hypothetical protein